MKNPQSMGSEGFSLGDKKEGLTLLCSQLLDGVNGAIGYLVGTVYRISVLVSDAVGVRQAENSSEAGDGFRYRSIVVYGGGYTVGTMDQCDVGHRYTYLIVCFLFLPRRRWAANRPSENPLCSSCATLMSVVTRTFVKILFTKGFKGVIDISENVCKVVGHNMNDVEALIGSWRAGLMRFCLILLHQLRPRLTQKELKRGSRMSRNSCPLSLLPRK